MAKNLEPRRVRVGTCASCSRAIYEGDLVAGGSDYDELEYHRDCHAAIKREIDQWNKDVREDREARG